MVSKKAWIVAASAIVVGGVAFATVAHERWGGGHGGHGHYGKHGAAFGGFGRHGRRAAMMRLFETLDDNQDGALTREEIALVLERTHSETDGDQSGALSIAEFETLWVEFTRPRMVDAFQHLDEDGDGQITDVEMKKPFDRMARFADRNEDGQIDRRDMRWMGRFGRHKDASYDDNEGGDDEN